MRHADYGRPLKEVLLRYGPLPWIRIVLELGLYSGAGIPVCLLQPWTVAKGHIAFLSLAARPESLWLSQFTWPGGDPGRCFAPARDRLHDF